MFPMEKNDAYAVIAELMSHQVYGLLEDRAAHVERAGKEFVVPTPYFFHIFQSDLEWYAEILVSLGILRPITNQPRECIFQFQVDPEDVYSHVSLRRQREPSFAEILAAFLGHSVDYGGGFRLYRSNCFPVSKTYDHLFSLLVQLGYAKRMGLEYQWTDKVSKAMELAKIWPIDDDSGEHERMTGRR
jgi:hypothetical protein